MEPGFSNWPGICIFLLERVTIPISVKDYTDISSNFIVNNTVFLVILL